MKGCLKSEGLLSKSAALHAFFSAALLHFSTSDESSRLYKEQTNKWHDHMIQQREFRVEDKVLLFNSRLKLFPGKLKSKWLAPCQVWKTTPYGACEILGENDPYWVNGQRLKLYHDNHAIGYVV